MKPILASFVLVLVIMCSQGCSLIQPATQPANLTPEQKLAQEERNAKNVSGATVRFALTGVEFANDRQTANQVATEINTISRTILAATVAGEVDLTTFRKIAVSEIAKISDARIRSLATTAIIYAVPFIETQIENQLASLAASEKAAAIRGLVASAAQGAVEATEVWVIVSPTTRPVK